MNIITVISLATMAAVAKDSAKPIFLTINSPDHPATWVVGAHQKSKILRWDQSQQRLVLDIKYSTQDYADNINNPIETDEHYLNFPNVQLQRNGVDLVASNKQGESVTIGHLRDGLFGKEIVLSKGVDLNVHRIEGKIYATLIYNALES